MRTLFICLCCVCLLVACQSEPAASPLPEGLWTGGLSAHEGHHKPLTYRVEQTPDSVRITLLGDAANGEVFRAHGAVVTADQIRFGWTEPEGPTPLTCSLDRQPDGSFQGDCSDATGHGAAFTMIPPQ